MIKSDDPQALEKLKQQLEALQADQRRMKAANALLRKNDQAGLAALGFTAEAIQKLLTPDFAGRTGFPPYMLTNNNANIKRIENRIAELSVISQRADTTQQGTGYTYTESQAEQRVMFHFDEKPSEAIREMLRRNGFNFSPSRNNAWVRQLTANGIATGQMLCKQLEDMATPSNSTSAA